MLLNLSQFVSICSLSASKVVPCALFVMTYRFPIANLMFRYTLLVVPCRLPLSSAGPPMDIILDIVDIQNINMRSSTTLEQKI